MSDLVYTFTFPRRALGLDVVITDNAGQTVAIADDPTLTLTADNGNAYIELSLPAGNAPYSAAVSSSRVGAFSTEGQVALAESIADAPGAAETAYLVATGPADISDGGGAAGNLNWTADPEHGELPDWVTLVSGDIVLDPSAGACVYNFAGRCDYDFTETTPPTAGGTLSDSFTITAPGNTDVALTVSTAGDGAALQTSDPSTQVGLIGPGTVSVAAYPSADEGGNIPDGVVTPRAGLNITRNAPAATIPTA